MQSLVKIAALIGLAAMLLPSGARAQAKDGSPEQFLFDSANRERMAQGLAPLKWDAQLAAAARQHASEMARQNTLSHQFPGEPEPAARVRQAGARFSAMAENVAFGPNPAEIHQGWMNSPPHRKNMLDPQLNSVGIAVVARGDQLYAVQDFARTVAQLSLEDQEARVSAQLKARGLTISTDSAEARHACESGLNRGTSSRPAYMLRFSIADLDKLPDAVDQTVRSGRYHAAEVGACPPAHSDDFAGYQVAILFYP